MAGFSPLHYAAWYSRERIAQFLLSFDIDPNQSGTVGDRALHIGKKTSKYVKSIRIEKYLNFQRTIMSFSTNVLHPQENSFHGDDARIFL